jgi:uncharacterized protein (TIRG00374 family)
MKFLFKSTITVILLGLIVWQLGDFHELGTVLASMAPMYVLFGLLVSTGSRILMTYKWALLLRGRDIHLPFFRGMMIYCASCVWGMFLPSTVGADAIRAVSTSRSGLDSVEVVASIVMERIIGFLASMLLGLAGLCLLSLLGFIDARFSSLWWAAGAILVGFTAAFIGSFSETGFNLLHDRVLRPIQSAKIVGKLRQLHSTYQCYQRNKPILLGFFGLTIAEQSLRILFTWILAKGLNIDIDLLFIAGVVPLTIIVSRLPVSISGWGVMDGAFLVLLSLAGVSGAEAIALALMTRLVQVVSWLPWWITELLSSGKMRAPALLAPDSRS